MITTAQKQKTQEHLDAADRAFASGNPLAATECLWDAVATALSAVARHNGWPHSDRAALYDVAVRLNELDDDPDEPLLSGFSAASYQPDKVRYGFFDMGDGCDDDARMIANWVIKMIQELDKRYDHAAAKSAH